MSINSNDATLCHGSTFQGNRDEITDLPLNIKKGALPDNLYGLFYFQSQCGNPNSGGLPFSEFLPNGEPNPDWGSPMLNGDGMVYKIDFNQTGKAIATCRIMKNPAYYADLVTSNGDDSKEKGAGKAIEDGGYKHFKFKNYGISRMNLLLGAKNQLNTALIPVAFPNEGECLLSTSDVSRPWKMDPVTLELVTPVGWSREWVSGMPPIMQQPIPMFETTAHPTYDPLTKELYISNYTMSSENQLSKNTLRTMLHMDRNALEKKLMEIYHSYEGHQDKERAILEIKDYFAKNAHKHTHAIKENTFYKNHASVIEFIKSWLSRYFKKASTTYDQTFLYTFDNKGDMKQNRMVDENGHVIVIHQCMHQTSITENYVILMDTSFKFSFDLLINNPFPNNELLDKFIRKILDKRVMQTTSLWLVDRNELRNAKHKADVLAKKIPNGLPAECVHFTTEYDDSNNEVVMYSAQNNATCLAEWVRTYDTNYFTKEKPLKQYIGNFAVGELDVNSMGKYVIDTEDMVIKTAIQVQEKGNLPPIDQLPDGPLKDIGPNTWGIGLYAFRDFISSEVPSNKIEDLFFVSFGATPQQLTNYIHRLYKYIKGRTQKESDEVLAYTEKGIPGGIMSMETETMTFTGHFEFPIDALPTTIQFMPCKTPTPGIKTSQDGYVIVTVKACNGEEYRAELWIFEAWDVSKGPICILDSTNLNFCTTLHSAWLAKAEPFKSEYNVDIEKDFNYNIGKSFLFFEKPHYKRFFENYIYPHFKK